MPIIIKFLTFAFIVLQTAVGNPHEAIYAQNTVTQYSLARNGTIGILAHEENSGYSFSSLAINDIVTLEYPERVKLYRVETIERYLASNPASIYSSFENIETGQVFSAIDLGAQMYLGYDRLVLQTCYDGIKGRLFVIAYPIKRGMERKGN